jgi:hypothetical protein
MQYESAGHRRDGAISREGSVELRRALIDLGIGLWQCDPAAKAYAAGGEGARETWRDHRVRPGAPREPIQEWLGIAENLAIAGPSETGTTHFVEDLAQQGIDAGMRLPWFTLESQPSCAAELTAGPPSSRSAPISRFIAGGGMRKPRVR